MMASNYLVAKNNKQIVFIVINY